MFHKHSVPKNLAKNLNSNVLVISQHWARMKVSWTLDFKKAYLIQSGNKTSLTMNGRRTDNFLDNMDFWPCWIEILSPSCANPIDWRGCFGNVLDLKWSISPEFIAPRFSRKITPTAKTFRGIIPKISNKTNWNCKKISLFHSLPKTQNDGIFCHDASWGRSCAFSDMSSLYSSKATDTNSYPNKN